jgi:hypothetical protein
MEFKRHCPGKIDGENEKMKISPNHELSKNLRFELAKKMASAKTPAKE